MSGCCRCNGLGEELQAGAIDEYLCTYCGRHEYRSTNHQGKWVMFVGTPCLHCKNAIRDKNTDGYRKSGACIVFCNVCKTEYVWKPTTGWELGSLTPPKNALSSEPAYMRNPLTPNKYPILPPDAPKPPSKTDEERFKEAYWEYIKYQGTDVDKELSLHNAMTSLVDLNFVPEWRADIIQNPPDKEDHEEKTWYDVLIPYIMIIVVVIYILKLSGNL